MALPRVPCSTVFSHIDGRTIQYGGSGPTLEMVSARLSFDPAVGEPLMALLPNLIHVALGDSEANVLQTTLHLIGMETGASPPQSRRCTVTSPIPGP